MKTAITKSILLLLLLVGCSTVSFAQANILPSPQSPYLSPEAASLGKYGEIPVNEYSGLPDINIPLHTVRNGYLELPISLTYHASGIKVAQEATWVGLGWDLQAGGCINRIVSGNYDKEYPNYTSWAERAKFFAQNSVPFTTFGDNSRWGGFEENPNSAIYPMSLYQDFVYGMGEPDIFQACFCGHSISFIIHPGTGKPVIVGEGNPDYKIEGDDSFRGYWKITDNNGIQYWFEWEGTEIVNPPTQPYISSWFLTRIVHPLKGTINLNYDTSSLRIKMMPLLSQRIMDAEFECNLKTTDGNTAGGVDSDLLELKDYFHYNQYSMDKKYLKSITTPLERIDFHKSTREDIDGYSRKLDSLTVTSLCDNRVILRAAFEYNYYASTKKGGDFMEDKFKTTANAFRYKRLKLEKATIGDQVYSFGYNTTPLPYKTSYATDFWGYYNGYENKSFLCAANLKELATGTAISPIGDANRYVDSLDLQAGILQKITYPTKGYTLFEYEPNSFIDTGTWCPLAKDVRIVMPSDTLVRAYDSYAPNPATDVPFTLEKETQATVEFVVSSPHHYVNDLRTAIAILMTMDGTGFRKDYTIPVQQPGDTKHSYVLKETLTLPAGHYLIHCNFPSDKYVGADYASLVQLTVKYPTPGSSAAKFKGISYGGGLRVASISQYESDGTLLRKRTYDYSNEDGRTSGRLLLPIPKVKKEILYVGDDRSHTSPGGGLSSNAYAIDRWKSFTLSSSVKMPAFTSLQGTPVGYSRVTVKDVGNGINNGSTVSRYHNSPAVHHFYDVYLFDDNRNGKMTGRIFLNAEGKIVQKQEWNYVPEWQPLMLNAFATDLAPGIADCSGFLGIKRYRIQAYPFKVTWTKLTEERTTDICYEGNIGKQIQTVARYEYNTKNHLPSAIRESVSNSQDTICKLIRYADSFAGTVAYDSLLARNMTGLPIETIEQRNSTTIARSKNNYSLFGQTPRLSGISLAKGSNAYELRMRYTRYDTDGNVLELVRPDGVTVSYLWAYNNQYPIAEIEGMEYATVTNLLTPSYVANLSRGTTSISMLQSIRTKLSGAIMRGKCYCPSVGISGEIGSNGYGVIHTYDSNGRLQTTSESGTGNLIKRYDYNYKR